MIRKIIKIILVFLCMGLIFYFSSDNSDDSTKKSDGLIIHTIETFTGKKLGRLERKKYIDKYVVPVRKTAHFSIYFLLGLLFSSLLKEYSIQEKKIIIITILFVFFYACSDEFHQTFIPGRSGEMLDIGIDTLGGTLATISYTKLKKVRRKKYE